MNISVGILAGGRSSRMGTNKALLPIKGIPFIETIIKECEAFSSILLSVNDIEPYQYLGKKLVQDELEGFGPLEGIYQILKAADTEYTLILATDMPYINKAFLKSFSSCLDKPEILKNQQGEMPGCIVLRAENMLEPLCSLYSKHALPYIEDMRKKNDHKLRILYDWVYTIFIDIEDLGYSKDILLNINTPEEYNTIKK